MKSSRCRTCLSPNMETVPLLNIIYFDEYKTTLTISELVIECASVELPLEDSKPKSICNICVTNATTSYLFRRKCKESQSVLNEEYTDYQDVKVECFESGGYYNDTSFSSEDDEPLVNLRISENLSLECAKLVKIEIQDSTECIYKAPKDGSSAKDRTCILCKKIFKTLKTFQTHSRKKHNKSESTGKSRNECTVCFKSFSSAANLANHRKRHNKRYIKKEQASNYARELKRPVLERTCAVCAKVFTCRKYMVNHRRATHAPKIPLSFCSFCSWTGTKGDLAKHRTTLHSHLKEFKCDHCEKMFFTNDKKKCHMLVHTRERKHMCEVCGVSFALKENLNRHKRIHTGERPYKCDKCDMSFGQYTSLQYHGYTHTSEPTFVCSHCGKTFFRQGSLRLHLKKHAPIEEWEKCMLCDKRFPNKPYLKNHMVVHTGERNHKCTICEKAFGDKSSLRKHLKIHSGEKPHICQVCNKSFALKHLLKSHMRTHSK